ncbi:winged helix-turn-helix domain-containing protein [Pseudomonas frederiksbergensis]|uniref:winged helix-turn-helix domain-containing protein n=1 Tax=Pseudomonas frederiksbergensis TaxID=104087 RepID=UPI003D071D9B
MMPCVLVVSENPLLRDSLQGFLAGEGYEVYCADSADQADACLERLTVGLVLLDAHLQGRNALALTRQWRACSEVGIILVGGDDAERLAGLECGADDYLTQPLASPELLTRARNLLRRVHHAQLLAQPEAQPDAHLKRFADWTLDTDRRRLKGCDGRETLLSHGEFQLLNVFMRNSGHTLSRDQLMDQLRNREWLPNDRSIDVLVGRLRRKLHDDPAQPELIITIHGAGYLFTAGASLAA